MSIASKASKKMRAVLTRNVSLHAAPGRPTKFVNDSEEREREKEAQAFW